jgi:hypothetical protein
MKKFTSRLVTICLRVAIIFAVGIALIFSSELEFSGNKMQAIATPLTPEAKSYEVASPDRQPTTDTENDARSVLDNIREKLNLDQPIALIQSHPVSKYQILSPPLLGREFV